ncbi:internalin, putative [Alloactinosynnema sp. L-07]|uniref:SdrD B-like domain-containing protein n=1 Tax=Alloactinosynnema sp. L-07 TaxID=1653480 RepID=UPI00065EF177|nr:SdrD B-like domain-containing protein [Alloactinosynnema sp. L-07]CRK62069.1 internalin, putative [Alloactinosynnema sp. L-07]
MSFGMRKMLASALSFVAVGAATVVLTPAAQAAVIRPFALNYNAEIYGDFIMMGNGNMRCPTAGDPVDPFGHPIARCAQSQARTLTTSNDINDSFYMRHADVDASALTFNSSTGSVTVPAGARVEFARLNWAGDTGVIRADNGTIATLPGCNTRQFLAGAGTSILPAGTPETTSVRLTVGAGATAAVAPAVISRDSLASVPTSQPQFYAAYADVTAQFAAAPTGVAQTVTVGNVWTPTGFGCVAGWSIVLVYAFDGPNPAAPFKREVFMWDGHVRQSATDPATTTPISGFRVGAAGVRVGVTAHEGDFNIVGDQFSINGTPVGEPLAPATTNNFFVSNAVRDLNPAPPNNMSTDAKEFNTALLPVGATSANLTFSTSGDTYLAQNLVFSVPIPSVEITKSLVNPGPFRPGQVVTYSITVVSPSGVTNAVVTDAIAPGCARNLGILAPNVPVTYQCTGPAQADDYVNSATVTATDPFGDPLTDTATVPVVVINPNVDITKQADKPSYLAGETITFTIVVHNSGDAALTNLVVSDPTVPSCATTRPLLGVGDSFTYTCTATAPIQGDSNTVTVTGTDPLGGPVTDTAVAPAPTVGSVSGTVFSDGDNDGLLNGTDTGIGGVTVTLTGTTAAGQPFTATTTTAADGTYSFTGVPGGSYTLTETQPAAFDDGIDTPGTLATPAGNDAFAVVLTSGQVSAGNNFAERPTSSLAGAVYEDVNNNGLRDAGEAGIGGTTVTLTGTDDAGNAVSRTATTAADGTYSFPALRAGTYAVAETQPAAYVDGIDTPGTAAGTVTPPDSITAIALPARTNATGYLFGEFKMASISGKVVDDAGNPIPNVTMTLTRPDGSTATVQTGPDGTYAFNDLPPGTYSIVETQPAGYGDGPDTLGSAGGTAANDAVSGIVLGSGIAATGYDFAEDRGSLAGVVYEDVNNNGVQDAGEPGIPGATVTLTGTDIAGAPVNRVLTTDGNGAYVFDGVLGGTYSVTETQPDGYADGTDRVGTAGGTLAQPDSITAIDLTAGADATGYLFGEFKMASISGKVVDDAGNPIPNVTMTLTRPDGSTATVQTGPDGTYSFNGLPPGTYSIAETQPAGYGDGPDTLGSAGGTAANDAVSGIVLGSGIAATGYDFAEDRGSLAGVVYEDVNNNGIQDAGEPGIPGATVTLTGTDAAGAPVNRVVTTDANGAYVFDGVLGGTYSVTETQPDGYADGIDTEGSSGGTVSPPDSITAIDLAAGVDATGYLFGEFKTASISGKVVDDAGNPIPNVTMTLTRPDGSIALVQTGPDGTYSFTDLLPGTYSIAETQPAGYADGPDTLGSAGGTPTNDAVSGIVLGSGIAATGYDFAEDRGSLAGVVYEDVNNNGIQDAGEPGIPGATVTLTGTDAAGAPVDRVATTDGSGAYVFADLLGGTYTVTETQPDGYADGTDRVGTAGGTLAQPDTISAVALPAGADATGYLFGEFKAASISGRVVDDAGNPIPNVTMTLTRPDGSIALVQTGPDGTYAFNDLPPGTYSIVETQPAGYADGPDTLGSAGGTATNDAVSGIVLGSGTAATGYDFAEDRASLAGVVYEDVNNNGIQDAGEPGIPGATVTLTGTDATGAPVSRTATTDGNGAYVFADLLGGTYTVTETQPDGYADGIDRVGTAGGTLGQPDTISAVALPAGADATGYLFGEFKAASISGRVVDDAGNPIPNVTMTLTNPDGSTATVQTGPDGTYSFTDLLPGTYSVAETQPNGYGDGVDTPGSAGGVNSANDVISAIVLGSGTAATGYDFAEDRGSLAGVVYEDVNNNGIQDAGEPGIPGATVTLTGTDAAGAPVDLVATTDGSGAYVFADLLGGTYTVTETQPDGYADGTDRVGTAGGTLAQPDTISAVALPAGADATGYLFGEFKTASISGRVVDDAGNPMPNVTMTLTRPDGSTATVQTGPDGTYSFSDLPPGTYSIVETQPAGYADGPDTLGSAGGTPTNDAVSGIVLGSGTTASGYDFAEDRASLAGVVYEDVNNNGIQDAGEPGIPGTTVTLTGTDATGAPVNRVVTSDGNGAYVFPGLLGGTYTVTETQPDGYTDGTDRVGTAGGTLGQPDTINAVALPAGADATGYLFGEFKTASISGRVVDDAGNPIPNVTVTLTRPDGSTAIVQTGPDGTYSFTDLPPGTYSIVETQPAGYADGPDTVGSAGGTQTNDAVSGIVLGSGTAATGYDFAEDRGSLAGVVYEDVNNNGIQDAGEPGIPGATVTLTGTDATGAPVDRTATTDANGAYLFDGVLGGTYSVSETQPDGYADGIDTEGSSGGTVSPPDSITAIDLAAGVDATGYLFGEFKTASISGRVVDDAGNPIPNVTMTLTRPDGSTATVQTGPDGTYAFNDLPPGTYSIAETQPVGYADGPDTLGSAGGTPTNDMVSEIVLGSGTAATGYDFAEDRASLAGVVYEDVNNNGIQDAGEPGIPGATVTLTGTDATGAPVDRTATTDANGAYVFDGVLGGTYTVTETQPDGYADGIDTEGSSGGTLSPPDSITAIDLTAGVDATGYLFGEFKTASISGRVVDDAGNPIPNVTVTLTRPDGSTAIVQTGPDGTYSFTDLPPGTYSIAETQPAGYADGPDTVGSAGGTPTNDMVSEIVLGSGTAATGYDFAEDRASLAGVVYEDVNNNGIQDAGEPGIPGATVTLTGTDATGAPVDRTATTDANGAYVFDGVLGGTYSVTETQPDGYADGIDTPGTAAGTVTPPDSITAIDLAAGVDATGYLFGEFTTASIAGKVVDDAGNPIPNVTMTLTKPDGSTATVQTGPDGTYSFTDLLPGTYSIAETQPAGYADGPDTVGSAGGTPTNDAVSGIVLGSGTAATGYDFAEDRASLAGVVYEDVNNNGIQDAGEPGIPGATVTLTGTDASGASVDRTATTDGSGAYVFADLLGGTYTVTETQPDGYADGTDRVGTAGGTLGQPDTISAVALPAGADATGYLFGEFKTASISGRVVDDAGNPIPNVTMTLTRPDGSIALVQTGPDGTYAFNDLPPGTYSIAETQPAGYADGPDTLGSAGGTATNDTVSEIVLGSGTAATGYDFAEDRGSLAGVVYEDVNNNGIQDAGEPGIPGAIVTLTGTDAVGAPVNRVITTDTNGAYVFDGVLGGTYEVSETQPAGYADGIDTEGSSGGTVSPPDSITAIELTAGADATGYLFGEFKTTSISGKVVDDSGNPIPNVTMTLTKPDGSTATVQTGPDGTYSFTDLQPGTYSIAETQPDGYADGPDTLGSAGGTPTNDAVSGIVLGSGTAATGYDFAEDRGSLAGFVYQDLNDNGVKDPGEPGIGGVSVQLTGTDAQGNAVDVTVTTGGDGGYLFEGLVGGTYTLNETQPAFLDGLDAAGSAGGTVTPPDSITAIELGGGVDATDYLFGELPAASISGKVVDDGGNPIAGVTITLTNPDGSTTAVQTGADGTYTFPNLRPGTYTVTETQPTAYGDGPDTAGSAGGTAGNDVISGIVLTPGTAATDYVFAEQRGSLAGVVYVDANDNGVRDAGEPGIPGATVTLTGPGGATTTVQTGADGAYLFTGLVGGDYILTETQPAGYADGTDTPGSAGGSATPPDTIAAISLGGGEVATDYLFGERGGAITGTVYVDRDGDGVIDVDETGRLGGVTVILRDSAGTEIARTTTAPDGSYEFPNVPQGDYTVEEEQPKGYGSTTPNSVPVTVPAGGGAVVDFGERLGSIGDRVWSDTDRDGVQDAGEPGVPDVVVILLDGDGVEVTRTTSGPDGSYRFTDLPEGTYVVTVEPPAGQVLTRPNQSGEDVDSDLDWITGRSGPIVIAVTDGEITQRTDVDAGLVPSVLDLGVTLTTDKPTAAVGDKVVFTDTVTNIGTIPVTGAKTVITIPPGLVVESVSGSGWTCATSGNTVTCTTDRVLLPGESAPPITVVTKAATPMPATDSVATVSKMDGTADGNPANDRAATPVAVTATPVPPQPTPGPPQPTPVPPQPGPRPPLAVTGADVAPLLVGALALLLVGAGFLLAGQRRRRR